VIFGSLLRFYLDVWTSRPWFWRWGGTVILKPNSATIRAIDQGALADAMNKLTNDLRQKLDGCTAANAADKNDWLLTCASQDAVYPLVAQAIDVLKYLQ
jgi:hypothetical protein